MTKKKSAEIYLVRHGETDWNLEKRLQGSTDIPLNDNGRSQAKILQAQFENILFDAVCSSDLLRAKETAEIISSGKNLAVTTTTDLRERSWGAHEGQIFDHLRVKYGENFKPLIENYDHHLHDQLHPELVQVESYSKTVQRVLPFLKAISQEGKSVLAVSHGGVLKGILLHLQLAEFNQPYVDNTAYLHLEVTEDGFTIKGHQGVYSKPI